MTKLLAGFLVQCTDVLTAYLFMKLRTSFRFIEIGVLIFSVLALKSLLSSCYCWLYDGRK